MEKEIENHSSGRFYRALRTAKPYIAMISLQFGFAGQHIVTVMSLKGGLNHWVLSVYRHLVAMSIMAPFAFVLERKVRPKMTLRIFIKIAVLAFLEPVIDQNLYYIGLSYTSATFASALYNILPAITFVMAIIFRLEKVKIKKFSSQAKIIGTLFTVAGAMIMTLYQGPLLDFVWSRGRGHHAASTQIGAQQNIPKGTLALIASSAGWAGFFILQRFALDEYPVELSLSTLICFMGIIEAGAVALVFNRNVHNAWAIGWDSRLLAPVYSGIVCSGIAYYVQGVVTKDKGPVFVTAFNPLCMVIVAVLGSLILAEEIHLGRVIGAIIIVFGLYSVVWGKRKEAAQEKEAIEDKEAFELPVTDTGKLTSGNFAANREAMSTTNK